MTVVGLRPVLLRNATLLISEDDYTQSVNEVVFVPQVEYRWVDTFAGGQMPVYERVRWVAILGYAQDFTTPDSMAMYLIEHAAQTRRITLVPEAGSGQTAVSADVLIVPGQLGGAHGQLLTGQVALPLFDDPIIGPVV